MSEEEAIEICKRIKENMKYESNFDLNILKLNRNNEIAIGTLLQSREKDKAEIEKQKEWIYELVSSYVSSCPTAELEENCEEGDCTQCWIKYIEKDILKGN